MPKIGDIVIMPDGNKVRYLEMMVAENERDDGVKEVSDGVQRESKEITSVEQSRQ